MDCGIGHPGWTESGHITVTRRGDGGYVIQAHPQFFLFPYQATQLAAALSAHLGDGAH